MLTRKGLQALAEGIADGAAGAGITWEQAGLVAICVVGRLRSEGAVTPNYDGERFHAALAEAFAFRGVERAA